MSMIFDMMSIAPQDLSDAEPADVYLQELLEAVNNVVDTFGDPRGHSSWESYAQFPKSENASAETAPDDAKQAIEHAVEIVGYIQTIQEQLSAEFSDFRELFTTIPFNLPVVSVECVKFTVPADAEEGNSSFQMHVDSEGDDVAEVTSQLLLLCNIFSVVEQKFKQYGRYRVCAEAVTIAPTRDFSFLNTLVIGGSHAGVVMVDAHQLQPGLCMSSRAIRVKYAAVDANRELTPVDILEIGRSVAKVCCLHLLWSSSGEDGSVAMRFYPQSVAASLHLSLMSDDEFLHQFQAVAELRGETSTLISVPV